jgi:hypothetical protein
VYKEEESKKENRNGLKGRKKKVEKLKIRAEIW